MVHGGFLVGEFKKKGLKMNFQTSFSFLGKQLWRYSETTLTLENKLGEWMHGNKTWTIPKENGEGYIVELENNSSVMGLMDGKSLYRQVLCCLGFCMNPQTQLLEFR